MKRSKLVKSLLSVLLASTMVFLAACGGGTGGDSTTKEGNNSEGSNTTEAAGDEFTGYPMDTDVTISWYVNHGYILNTAYGSAEESPFHRDLEKNTGVDIEWKFPTAGADGTQDLNLLLASDTLPDIIYGAVMKEADRHVDEGTIRDLADDIETHSPNYYQFLQSNEMYDKAMKTDSGVYIGYGFFREDGGWNDTYMGPVVRQDLLSEQNLESPKTISEFENVIKVFKEEYDMSFSYAWSRWNSFGIAGAFGAYGGTVFRTYVDDDGKVQLAQAQPEWRDYMVKLNEWWEAGLMDQDVMTLDDSLAQSKALNEAMGISFTSMGQMSNWIKDAEAAENGADWVGLQYPTDDEGNLSSVFGGYGIEPSSITFISSDIDDEKLPVAMRLMDYAYTEEGNLYWNFGTEGESWEYNDDGEVEYLPVVLDDPDGLNNAISKYGGSTWSGPCIQATRLLYLKNTEQSIKANDVWFYENEEQTYKDKLPAGVSFTADESTEILEIQTAISTLVSETAARFMIGEQDLDTFDDFVAQLNDMGLERLLEINQNSYDRFMAR